MIDKRVEDFLRESNAIENVWDNQSLKTAIKAWKYIIKFDKLTAENVKETHAILMKGKLDAENTGEFRKCAVYIGYREGKPWYAVPTLTEEWCKRVSSTIAFKIDIGIMQDLIKMDHVAYETIHPFIDGNGRTGRIFMNWQRAKVGLPVLVLWEKEKYNYYEWFNEDNTI